MDLVPLSPEDEDAARLRAKVEATRRIMAVLDALEPWVTGVMDNIQPNQVAVYFKGVREIGLLWGAYDKPKPVEDVKGADEEQMVLEARQAAASAELTKLREVAAKRRPSGL